MINRFIQLSIDCSVYVSLRVNKEHIAAHWERAHNAGIPAFIWCSSVAENMTQASMEHASIEKVPFEECMTRWELRSIYFKHVRKFISECPGGGYAPQDNDAPQDKDVWQDMQKNVLSYMHTLNK